MVRTHCPYCALQCGTHLESTDDGVRVRPDDEFPVNQGSLCQKGWTAPELLSTPDRLTTPLVDGCPESWDVALDRIAEQLLRIRAESGPDAVGVFGGGGLTNEKAYALGKFARVALGTSQVDYNGRYCMSSAAAAGKAAFGLDRGLPFPVTDLAEAEVVVLAGANPAETMPPLMRHLNRADLIVIDPRRTATAEGAALHLAPAPGTDLVLALGLLHMTVLDGYLDAEFVRRRTEGFEQAWQRAAEWWPERTERVTGVSVSAQRRAARMLGTARRRYVLTGRGAEQHSKGTDTVSAFINLALALGLPGREGSGYGCLTGQGNGQGGREHGQKADQLPGYRDITDPAAREHVARVWGVEPEALPGPGRSAYELMEALGTPSGPRALLVFGSNPAVSTPDAARVVDRLSSLDLLVVADFVPSETARMADVVLPVTQWAEEDGTMTNLEGRVLRRRRVVRAPMGVRGDLDVLSGLAERLGQPAERFPAEPRDVFEELRRASEGGPADYSGVHYDDIEAGPVHWPCAEASSPRLFLKRFEHPDGRARFRPVGHRDAAELPDDAYPLYATTGRVLVQYQTGAQTRRVAELDDIEPEAFVEVHPETARRSGLGDGQSARVVGRRGKTRARVRHVSSMRTDTVFLPFHFPEDGRANLITNPALDPTSKMPEFKVCAVRLESVVDESEDSPATEGVEAQEAVSPA